MRKSRAAGLNILATVLFVTAVLVPFVLVEAGLSWPFGSVLTGPLTIMGLWCIRLARQARLRSAEAAMSQDLRRPVLYLRPFRADALTSTLNDWRYPFVPWQRGYFERLRGGLAFDTMLEPAVQATIGPFISLGKPGDKLVPFGASRLYEADDNWQEAVHDLIRRAAAILVVGIHSEGVLWELRAIHAESDPTKVFLVTLPSEVRILREEWHAFRQRALDLGYLLPPQYPGAGVVMAFDCTWAAKPILEHAATAEAYVNAIAAKLAASRSS
jgi:hypothetical protein